MKYQGGCHCGAVKFEKSFYIPRSNPDGYDINVRCLDPQPKELEVEPFDGKNWELHGHKMAHMSKESI